MARSSDHWIVWIHASKNFEYGTYLALYDTGKLERITTRPDEPDDVWLIKPEDGKE